MYEEFVEKYLEVTYKGGAEWSCYCPVHENVNTPSFRINVESGLCICYSCGFGGNIEKLRDYLGATDALESADSDIQGLMQKLDAIDAGEEEAYIVPETVLARYENEGDYWPKRGFTDSTIAKFQLGLDIMGNYATIPFREFGGGLLGVIKRYFDPESAGRKYKYPKKFKKSEELFGSWLVYKTPDIHTAVLVEGALDAIRLWQAGIPALAIYGSELSTGQKTLLDFLDIREVVLFFDNDDAGWKATKSAMGIKHKVYKSEGRWVKGNVYVRDHDLRMLMNVKRVRYPRDYPEDPGAMSSKQLRYMVENAIRG